MADKTYSIEISLDATKALKGQNEVLAGFEKNSADIGKLYKNLGTQSDQMYGAMRANIENSLAAIKKSHLSSADEIRRAQESAAKRIGEINRQQFGEQKTLLEKAKSNWLGLTATVAAVGVAVNRAMAYMEQGARAMQQESSFKIVAEQSGIAADTMIDNMKRLVKNTVDDSDMMQKATKLMLAGFDEKQIERFTSVAITASQYAGVSVSEAFETMADAIANKTPKALVKMGAVTRDQMSIVTKAIEAGAESTALFELAIANLEVKQLKQQGRQDEATLSMQQFQTQVKNTTEDIGKGLIRALQVAFGSLQVFAANVIMAYGYARQFLTWVAEKTGSPKDAIKYETAMTEAMMKRAAELEEQGKKNISGKAEVEKKATAEEIKNAEKTRDALLAKFKAMGEAAKDAGTILKSLMSANKEFYEAAIGEADRWRMRQQDAGADELATTESYYDKRWAAAQQYYENDKAAIEKSALKAAAKTAALSALDQRYEKEKSDLLTREERDQINYNARHLTVMANLYKTVDQYSQESINAQIAQLRGKYVEDGRWASATKDQRILLEKALNTEILKLTRQLEIQKRQVVLSYMATAQGPNSAGYRDQVQAQLNAQADLMEIELRGTGVVFDRKAWINAQLLDFDRQQMESKAAFYDAIEGFEAKALETGLAAIELRRQAEIKLYGDVQAANKKASDAEGKLAQDLFLRKTKYISEGFGDLSKSFYGISKLYKEGSEDAKRWQKASEAMEIAQRAVAVVNAVAAIANQGLGDPYTAFARIAAMAAAMGALLAGIGESINGGGGSEAAAAASLPASTRLGAEAGTGSESISRSYELLQDTYSMEYRELTRIWKEVRNLNQGLTGLVTEIVRFGGGNISLPSASVGSKMGFAESLWQGEWLPGGEEIMKIANVLTLGMSGFFNDLIGGFLGGIFGGGSESWVQGGGLQTGSPSVRSLRGGGSSGGQTYTTVQVHEDGGWFSSDKDYTYRVYGALTGNIQTLLDKVFKNMGDTLVDLSIGLGVDVEKALNYVFPSVSLDLKGKTTEEINKILNESFSNMADTAADAIFGNLIRQYQKLDEGLMETAVRLIADKEVVLNVLKMTNQFVVGVSVMDVIALTESLVDLAGGLDRLQESAGQYYTNFFSDAEKADLLYNQLALAFADMNMVMPETRGAFRDLVEAQNLMTESGRENYIALLNMAEATDQFFSLMEKTMQSAVDQQGRIVSELQGYVDKLKGARESMRMEGTAFARQQTETAKLAFAAVLDAARGGDLSGIKGLDRSLSMMVSSANSTSGFSTREDYQRNFYQTYNSIAELEGLAGTQLTVEQQTLKALQDQLDVLKKIEVNTGPERIGVDDKGYAISPEGQAKRAADEAAAAAEARQAVIAPRPVSAAGSYLSSLAMGPIISAQAQRNLDMGNPIDFDPFGFGTAASGGSVSSGWRLVGENGPELEYGGPSQVINNSKTRALIDNTAVVAELKLLREEMQAANYQIAKNTLRIAKIADRWDIDGIPEERTLT